MQILRPESLWLLLVLPLLWRWHSRSLAPYRGVRKAASLVARALLVVLIVLALSEPRWNGSTRQQEIFFVVDRSASTGNASLAAATGFAASAGLGDADTGWIGFGGASRMFPDLASLAGAAPEIFQPDETRLDNALALASAAFRPGRVRTLVVFSDAAPTGPFPNPDELNQAGIRVHTVAVPRADLPEVLVQSVQAPASVRNDEPLTIKASIRSNRATDARVGLFRNGIRTATRQMQVTPDGATASFDDRAGDEKLLHYEVLVEPREDTIAENNQAGAAVLGEGPSRALLLTDKPDSARHLEWALRQEGIELSVRPPEGTPTRMDDLQNFDVVIIDNVPASALNRAQMELLRSYVRDFGGGLLMLGGDQAFGLGGYFRTPVEDLLPASCDFSKEEETPSLALALVIDRSGSMSGEKLELAKAAAKASADLLGPNDYVSVIAFDSESYPVVPMQSAVNGPAIATEIASITEGGGTSIAPALEEAIRQLNGNPAKLKHVILLTDGMSEQGPFYELTSELARSNVTVSTVGVGEGADADLLTQIAQWGNGRFHQTNDPQSIPQIFTKETMTASKSAIQEFPFLARPARAADFLEGVPWDAAPFLMGYVRTRPKPTAETWLLTERGDPLLTTWRFGLGTSAAFTSDARNRWAVEWLRWPGFGKFWSQFLRRLSRPASLGLTETEVAIDSPRASVTVNALDPDELFPTDSTGTLKVAAPDGSVTTTPLLKSLPGRWTATFPATQRGIYSGQVVIEKAGQPLDSRFFTATKGFSREFLLDPPDPAAFSRIATETGGTPSPDPARVFLEDNRSAPIERELWPWLLALALALLVADIAIRRWPDRSP